LNALRNHGEVILDADRTPNVTFRWHLGSDDIWYMLRELSGQTEFLATNPLFLPTENCIFLVVFKLSDPIRRSISSSRFGSTLSIQ
jgi:hypothetical protein